MRSRKTELLHPLTTRNRLSFFFFPIVCLVGTSVRLGVRASRHGNLLHGRVDGTLDLLGLLLVVYDQGVEVAAAAHLELGRIRVLLDLHAPCVLAGADGEELLQRLDLTGHDETCLCVVVVVQLCCFRVRAAVYFGAFACVCVCVCGREKVSFAQCGKKGST